MIFHTIVWYKLRMDLRGLTDKILHEKTQALVKSEREVTLQVLQHLREVERRSLFATLSYSSLFEYAVKELKYSESAALRRISSMRLLRELPELEKKVGSGSLALSTLSQAQSFFRQEKTQVAEKREILSTLENKSAREVERELLSRSSEPEKLVKERVRVVSATHTELKFLVEEDFMSEVQELRALLSHRLPNASLKELIAYALKQTLKELRPKEPKEKVVVKNQSIAPTLEAKRVAVQQVPTPPTSELKNTRYIQAEVKRQVWKRDQGQCSFKCQGRRCEAKHFLEFDHIKPFALGGEATVENLRLRCRTHNQWAALKIFGAKKISQYVPRLK